TARSGKPCSAVSGLSFIFVASRHRPPRSSSASAFLRGTDPPKGYVSDLSEITSAPSNQTCFASALTPAWRSTADRSTPDHSALPMAPAPHGTPEIFGPLNSLRRFPAHVKVAVARDAGKRST